MILLDIIEYRGVIIEMSLVLGGILLGNIIFNNFEKHLPLWRRALKHGILFLILVVIRIFAGGIALLILLIFITIGQIILHAWWFPKNGINGLTAEPYDRYLELIRRMKGGSKNK